MLVAELNLSPFSFIKLISPGKRSVMSVEFGSRHQETALVSADRAPTGRSLRRGGPSRLASAVGNRLSTG